jgi:hypothetical protein
MMGKLREYKLVQNQGGSKVLSLTPLLPKDWKLVRLKLLSKTDNFIDIRIIVVRKVGENNSALPSTSDKGNR